MRLANILRRSLPIPAMRAGIPPTWDRPDPPDSQKFPFTKRLSVQQKHYWFFDASSPTYMLVNSEVAEGDLIEAFPSFIQRIAFLIAVGLAVGTVGFLWGNTQKVQTVYNFLGSVERLQLEKHYFDTKYGLKDLINNPWKLNAYPDIFPAHEEGHSGKSQSYEIREQSINATKQANQEALAYWNALYEKSSASLKSGAKHH